MTHEEAKRLFLLDERRMDGNESMRDIDQWDRALVGLLGCADPAPANICERMGLPHDSSFHAVAVELMTGHAADSHDPEQGMLALYPVYVKDVEFREAGTPSQEGFHTWLIQEIGAGPDIDAIFVPFHQGLEDWPPSGPSHWAA